MKINVGAADRVIRYLAGIILILAPLSGNVGLSLSTPVVIVCMIVGAILVGTAYFRFCPLYRALGASTCSR
jgi:hypothetical protein